MIRNFYLADDDPDDTEIFTEALMAIDNALEVNIAKNGKELILHLQEGKVEPHLIFLDINMPEMNGWQCLQRLKSTDNMKDIPVIMYSTSSSSIYGKKAVTEGAIGFYEKPTSFLQLQDFLKSIANSPQDALKETLKRLQETKKHLVYVG